MGVGADFFVGIARLINCGVKIKKLILDGIQCGPIQNFIMEKLRDALGATKTLEFLDL